MAARKNEPAPEVQKFPDPTYPAIESFIETATAESISATFEGLRAELAGLKGPRAEQGKKVTKAIDRTQELLSYLLQVREKLEADRKAQGGGRK